MGKIQDAIKKVQRNRSEAISSRLRARTQTIDNLESMSQDQAVAVSPDELAEQRRWDYCGPEIRIDLKRLIDAGLLDPDHSRKHLANEYRQVKKALLANNALEGASRIRRSNLIMIGSAEQGEGKSFISLNLAMSLAAESGYSVVLVDSDINNPRLSNIIGISDEQGLVDLLADPSLDPTQMISPTDVSGLSVLPAGKNNHRAAGLLASEQATRLFEDLSAADTKRVFVFDSSPILSSTEALELVEQVGQILLVVQSGKTLQDSVREALRKLGSDRPINILMNQVID